MPLDGKDDRKTDTPTKPRAIRTAINYGLMVLGIVAAFAIARAIEASVTDDNYHLRMRNAVLEHELRYCRSLRSRSGP
jgi:hypothetical protein